ncbi:ABC transporter ATP-binding protein [Nonomuraea gerenzanensis]|uniref:Nickel import system ATP-binding protein NikD n=1 Tax=Nonomuraea gerenzanensis TaxID=93944 RepID=A0A1M4E8K3_9ACTN|nr:ABC transporter ATP-binding protein [Nonomuraea gerenzanensis]UBU17435.1 ABC transporter ATP-binding protein [Nonomuraea gerenzanensis]SBO95190.1 Dipeptide transport ATP-binding protein DppD (TC 3.A.1.5.2) [Nonomuraea gerenzanensis]
MLRVDGLSVRFHLPGAEVHAVTDARFELREGRCLALVGESGCGKSVMAHALLGLLPGNATVTGHAWLDAGDHDAANVGSRPAAGAGPGARSVGGAGALDLVAAPEKVLARRVRGRLIGLIPQSPAAHLTPVRTARAQLDETLRELGRTESADTLAARAGLRPQDLDRYPHQLSGGMAQRVANALALAGDPPLIVADEPTTGLDRPLVDATMAELRRLCDEGRAVLVITHDLRAAERVADEIAVMYASRIVELSQAGPFFSGPLHPYARGLLDALPTRRFVPVPGRPPELTRLPDGCAFLPRCDRATAACEEQPLMNEKRVACHHA